MPSDGARALSFEQARSRLLQKSDALVASEANVDSKRDLQQASRSLRLPDITLDAREMKFQKSLDLSLGPLAPVLAPFGAPATLHLSDSDWRFRPSLTASMPIYTGGQISAAQHAAAAAVRQAEAEHAGERQSQTLQLVQLYFGQQLAAWALEVRSDVRDGLQRHLDDAEKLERGGMATKAQRLQATVARDQAERDFQRARHDHDTITATLQRFLREDRAVGTTTPLFVISTPLDDFDAFQRAARNHHPALLRLQAIVDQTSQNVRAQQAKLKPQIFLFGQRDLYRDDASLTEPDWVFGIGLKYDLVSSSNRPRQIGAARAQFEQAEAGLREAQNQVAISVTSAWNQLETARQQFLLLDSSIAQSRENLRLQELSFREGQATSLDVIDARLRLGSASIDRAQAAYQYDIALAQLLEVSGRIDGYSEYAEWADKVVSQ
ncbi:outer membrane efflux family protein [Lysobacter gummosus]|nr:outer membrane efflux family protein [Lysobacter gummosus]